MISRGFYKYGARKSFAACLALLVFLSACAPSEPEPPEPGLSLFVKGFTVQSYALSVAPGARQGGLPLTSPKVQNLLTQMRSSLDNRLRILPGGRNPARLDIEITRLTYASEEAQERLGAASTVSARVRVFGPDGTLLGERSGLSATFTPPKPSSDPGLSVGAGLGSSRDDDEDGGNLGLTLAIMALLFWLEAQEQANAPDPEQRPVLIAQDFTNSVFEWLTF